VSLTDSKIELSFGRSAKINFDTFHPEQGTSMPKQAKLNFEALEERTVMDATSPYASLAPGMADYGLYQPVYNYYDNGSMVQMVGWSATPVLSYYGGGFAYTPDAMVVSYTIVNFGNETSQGTNVVLYGNNAFSSFYGFGPTELASRSVGPLAPGQSFTETFVVMGDPSWAFFGPPSLSMSTFSVWSPTTDPFGMGNVIDFGTGNDFFNDNGLINVIEPPVSIVNFPQTVGEVAPVLEDFIPNVVPNLDPIPGQNLSQNLDQELDGLGNAALLMQEQEAESQGQQANQPVEQNNFQGTENALQSPLDQGGRGKEGKTNGGADGLEDPTLGGNAQDLEEAEMQLLFQQPKTRAMPNWLKKLLEENKAEEETPVPENNEDQAEQNDEQEEVQKKDAQVEAQVSAQVSAQVNVQQKVQTPTNEKQKQRSTPVVNLPIQQNVDIGQPTQEEAAAAQKEAPKPAPKPTEQNAKLATDQRDKGLSQQQAQMAYFILLGTGLSALQRRVRPDKAVADRENPRRKRLTRL